MEPQMKRHWPNYPAIPTYLEAVNDRREKKSIQVHAATTSFTEVSLSPKISDKQNSSFGLGIANSISTVDQSEISTNPAPAHQSTNFAQRIEKRIWNYNASGNIIKSWLLEIVSLIFSAACMGAIIVVLLQLQGGKIPRWPYGLTLNAYISVFSRAASASLLLPVSEALGQLKWSWFFQGKSKKMWDFEIFDNASRGPWGSILLLIRTRCQRLAALGAAITVFMIILDPFFQQLIDFPERWTLIGQSSIPRITSYNPGVPQSYAGLLPLSSPDLDLVSIAQKFFYDNGTQPMIFGSGTRPEIPLNCPTTNCTWPPYDTLGVCSACEDVSHMVARGCGRDVFDWDLYAVSLLLEEGYTTELICGYFLNMTDDHPTLMSGYTIYPAGRNQSDPSHPDNGHANQTVTSSQRKRSSNAILTPQNMTQVQTQKGEALVMRVLPLVQNYDMEKVRLYGGSINFKNYSNPIANFLISRARNGSASVYNDERPLVHECMLTWCVKRMQSSYYLANYEEKVTDVFFNTTPSGDPWEVKNLVIADQNWLSIDYTQNVSIGVPLGEQESKYTVPIETVTNTILIMDDFVPSFMTVQNSSADPTLRYNVNSEDAWPYIKVLNTNPWQASNNISLHMERMATAFTNVMRVSANHDWAYGDAFDQETFILVRWEWLALPLSLLLLSFIFLSATIYRAWREKDHVDVLKTSAIATLMYGLPDNMHKSLTTSSNSFDIGSPRTKAKDLRVKLLPSKRWRASGLLSPTTPKMKRNQPPPGWI